MHTRTLFAAITILLLLFISAPLAIVQADTPPPGVDTAQRDDVVPEDDEGGASGAVDDGSGALLPDVDNAQRDDVVPEDDGGGASGAVDEGSEGRLPEVLFRGGVVPRPPISPRATALTSVVQYPTSSPTRHGSDLSAGGAWTPRVNFAD